MFPRASTRIPRRDFHWWSFTDISRPISSGFRTEPPDPNLKPNYSERFHLAGYNRIQQEEAYKFYQQWTRRSFRAFSSSKSSTRTTIYDDSYAVNSANLGPYGDAIENELIPANRKTISRNRRKAGRAFSTAVPPADGRRWRSRCFIPITTMGRLWRARIQSIFALTRW